MCLAEVGVRYIVYLSDGGTPVPELAPPPGEYTRRWFNPRCGTYADGPDAGGDWVLLVESKD